MSTNDPLHLRQREHFSAPTGRVESVSPSSQRGQSASRSNPTSVAQELNEALADSGLPMTDDLLFRLGAELGFTVSETQAAIRSGMRSGLFLDVE